MSSVMLEVRAQNLTDRRGFSLVELVVVVGIIAIVMSMLLVVLGKVYRVVEHLGRH